MSAKNQLAAVLNSITKGSAEMTEMVLQVRSLPAPLFQLISTEKVRVREANGEIHLIPIQEKLVANDCPLLGLYASGNLSVDKHHEWSREDKNREEK